MSSPDDDDDVPEVTADDPYSALHQWLSDQLGPDDMTTAESLIADLLQWATEDDGWAADKIQPAKRARMGILAGDAYTGVNTVINRETIRELQAIQLAQDECTPHVGAITGKTSAFGVYTEALRRLGKPTDGLAGSVAAARVVFKANCQQPRRIATDSASASRLESMFPNMNRLSKRF